MVKIYYKTEKEKTLKELTNFKKGSWLFVEKPSEKELNLLTEKYNLDYDLLSDATDIYEVPRIEIDNNKLYIYVQFPYQDNDSIQTSPVLFVINTNYTLALSSRTQHFTRKLINGDLNFSTVNKNKLVLLLLLQINNDYSSFINNITRKVRKSTVKLEDIQNKDITQFVIFEATLNEFLSDLMPFNSVLNKILSGKFMKLTEEEKDIVEDLVLSNNQLIENARANLRNIVNIRNAYSTIMTNNLNRVIKLFTSLTVLLTIPTIISSIYGMNVHLPLDESPMAFNIIIGAIAIIVIGLLILFYKRKWL